MGPRRSWWQSMAMNKKVRTSNSNLVEQHLEEEQAKNYALWLGWAQLLLQHMAGSVAKMECQPPTAHSTIPALYAGCCNAKCSDRRKDRHKNWEGGRVFALAAQCSCWWAGAGLTVMNDIVGVLVVGQKESLSSRRQRTEQERSDKSIIAEC